MVSGLLISGLVGIGGSSFENSAGASTHSESVVKILTTANYGRILVTMTGRTLYTFARDVRNHSNCIARCATTWPPLILRQGLTPVGLGVSGLGSIVRSNGERQVTFRGLPLYRFVSDRRSGQISGQGVSGFHVAQLAVPRTTSTTTTVKSYGY